MKKSPVVGLALQVVLMVAKNVKNPVKKYLAPGSLRDLPSLRNHMKM
jgi:hypothetical protein